MLSGVAVVQLLAVYHDHEKSTVLVHYMITPSSAPNLQKYCLELPLEPGVNLIYSKYVRDS